MESRERSNDFADAVRYSLDAKAINRCFSPGMAGDKVKELPNGKYEHSIIKFEKYKESKQEELIKKLEETRDFLFGAEKYPFENNFFSPSYNVSHTGNGNTFVNDEFASKENLELILSKIEDRIHAQYNDQIDYFRGELIRRDESTIKCLEEGYQGVIKNLEDRVEYLAKENSDRMDYAMKIYEMKESWVAKVEEIKEANAFLGTVMWVSIAINIGLVITHIVRGL